MSELDFISGYSLVFAVNKNENWEPLMAAMAANKNLLWF